jgi:hypothetical protein
MPSPTDATGHALKAGIVAGLNTDSYADQLTPGEQRLHPVLPSTSTPRAN